MPNRLIIITPPATLTEDQQAQNAAHAETTKLADAGDQLLACLANARTAGAAAIYAGSPSAAMARFAAQRGNGGPLIAADLVARLLAGLYDPDHPAAASPLPPGVDILVRDASGNAVNITAIAAALQSALAPLLTASAVEVYTTNTPAAQ